MRNLIVVMTLVFASAMLSAQQWNSLGPISPPSGMVANGQINCIAFNPQNPNKIYAGAPAGGLWVSSDAGQNWLNAQIDTLSVIGISDIWINPADSLNMIIALGDRDENSSYVYQGGALYSTVDGGTSWQRSGELDTTGSAVPLFNFASSKIIKNTASGVHLLATSIGLFSSTNYGSNWNTRPYKEKVWDIKTRPNDATIVYAVIGGKIYRSLNGGSSFTQATTGLPSTVATRIQLAVTPANAAVVYAMYCALDGSFGGLYKSSDYGATWVQKSSSPNILAANSDGSGSKGQNNLALAVSQTNENIVFAGGVNVWKSVDGGTTWSQTSHYQGTGLPLVSADIHELKFAPAPRSQYLYACTGNGIFMSPDTGRTWLNYSSGLQVSQTTRTAHHPTIDSLYLAATPVGVLRYNKGAWAKVSDSATVDVYFHPTKSNVAYMATVNGRLIQSNDSGQTFSQDISPTGGLNGVAFTPYVFNPKNFNTIYALLRDIWKTTNGGQTWTRTQNTFNSNMNSLAISPKDTSVLYLVTADTSMYQTVNAGITWTRTSKVQLQNPMAPRAVYCHPSDPARVCCIGGRSVSMSTDAGVSWNKYVILPNAYINCMYWKADNCGEELIFGTSYGVWKLSAQFQFGVSEVFGSQMPYSPVNDLKVVGKSIRAATAGRGVYVSLVDDIGVKAEFSQDKSQVCPGEFIQFYDQTQFGGLTTKWEFQGGIPSTSTETAPLVRFDSPGDHQVKLVSASGCGKDSISRISVNVIPKLKAAIGLAKAAACVGDTVQLNDVSVGTGGTRDWSFTNCTLVKKLATSALVECTQTGQASATLTLSNTCGTNSITKVFEVYAPPSKPVVTVSKDTMSVPDSAGLSFQWFANGSLLSSGTGHIWLGRFSGDYVVRVTNQGGCRVTSDTVHFVKDTSGTGGPGDAVVDVQSDFSIHPNPASNVLYVRPELSWVGLTTVLIHDVVGRTMISMNVDADGSGAEIPISIQGWHSGMYTVEIRRATSRTVRSFVIAN